MTGPDHPFAAQLASAVFSRLPHGVWSERMDIFENERIYRDFAHLPPAPFPMLVRHAAVWGAVNRDMESAKTQGADGDVMPVASSRTIRAND